MGKIYSNIRLIFICSLFVILLVASIAIILFYPQNNLNKYSTVTIKPGFTLGKISNLLYEKNIISNKRMFELAAMAMGKEKQFPVGTFQIINSKNNYDIIDQLVNESPSWVKEMLAHLKTPPYPTQIVNLQFGNEFPKVFSSYEYLVVSDIL